MAENKFTCAVSKLLKYLLISTSIAYIAVYIVIACFRLYYPFDLEWLEGGSVGHVARILSGKLLYVSPSLEFIPFNYTPLFYYISAIVALIFNAGYFPLRLVSIISSIGCFYLIFLIVRHETKSSYSGILASGLFAATFHLSGSWFDMGRPDSLFLFILLSSLYVIRFKDSNSSAIIAGILISLAFLTKQTALPVLIPIIIYSLLTDWRRSIYFIITSAVIIFGSTLILDHIHDGWYRYYIFELPSNFSSRIVPSRFWLFCIYDILLPFKIVLGISLVYFMIFFIKPNKNTFLFYFLTSVGMCVASLAARLQTGGFSNVLMPAYAIISILFGLSFYRLLSFSNEMYLKKQLLTTLIYILCLLQFYSGYLIYNPVKEVPSANDYEAGQKLINTLSQIKGRIFSPSLSYMPNLDNKINTASRQSISDNILYGREDVKSKLKDELNNAFKEKRFSAVITDSDKCHCALKNGCKEPDGKNTAITVFGYLPYNDELNRYFEQNYFLKEEIYYSEKDSFMPISGLKTRPTDIYVPIDSSILN